MIKERSLATERSIQLSQLLRDAWLLICVLLSITASSCMGTLCPRNAGQIEAWAGINIVICNHLQLDWA